MRLITVAAFHFIPVLFFFVASPVVADTVKLTPLGSHDGEFCGRDRALIFEDPDGTRLLYDAGRTVAGAKDPRLGKIDVILVSHMHGDHVGNQHVETTNQGTCATPLTPVNVLPNTNSVNIALATKAKIITGSEMPKFFARKLKALGGDPKAAQLVRFGGSRKVNGVSITSVPAVHSNGIAGGMIGGHLGEMLDRQVRAGPVQELELARFHVVEVPRARVDVARSRRPLLSHSLPSPPCSWSPGRPSGDRSPSAPSARCPCPSSSSRCSGYRAAPR